MYTCFGRCPKNNDRNLGNMKNDENGERRLLYSDCSVTAMVIVLHKISVFHKNMEKENVSCESDRLNGLNEN